ncbi:MAG: hypothetical protein HYV45_01525 [Candidatus Moranbacteria bacterium]|nr:hypothetical protein [Candidatus Moranbacteria bacterium]
MCRRKNPYGSGKIAKSHHSLTSFAKEGVNFLDGLDVVKKITPATIRQLRGGGRRTIRIIEGKPPLQQVVEVHFLNNAKQVIFVVALNRDEVVAALTKWADARGLPISFYENGKGGEIGSVQ